MAGLIKERNILDVFCTKFCAVVEKYAKYIIVSGFVAIASGRTRGTEDIDLIVERMNKEKFVSMHNDLVKQGFVCMQSNSADEIYDSYLNDKLSVRYTDDDIPLPNMEIKFAKDELDEYQLKTRMKLPLTGLDVWFSSINTNIAFKEHLLNVGKCFRLTLPTLVRR